MDYDEYLKEAISVEEFNPLNDIAIFAGPLLNAYPVITKEEVKTLVERGEDVAVLCVTERRFFEAAHIPSSINIPSTNIETNADALLRKDDLIIVYSLKPECAASAVAADLLTTLGYEHVMRYKGGIEEWKAAGYPIETGKARGRAKMPVEIKKAA